MFTLDVRNCRKKIFYSLLALTFLATYFWGAPWLEAAIVNIRGDYVTLLQQGSTPTSPGSGYNRLYFKSDGFIYYLSSAGTEARVGFTNPMTTAGDTIYGGASGLPTRLGGGTSGYYYKANGATSAPSWAAFTQPTVQTFTSGSGTYTTPANVVRIEIILIGSGGSGTGSGSASSSSNGTAGDNSTFGSSLLTANGGAASNYSASSGGTGGGFTVNSPAIDIGSAYGDSGGGSQFQSDASSAFSGGQGGSTCLGGGGKGQHAGAGGNAQTNSGGGGAGGGTNGANEYTGPGGGGAGCVHAIINAPSSSYAYSIGASKTGGGAGTSGFAGGNSAAGKLIVIEYYQ